MVHTVHSHYLSFDGCYAISYRGNQLLEGKQSLSRTRDKASEQPNGYPEHIQKPLQSGIKIWFRPAFLLIQKRDLVFMYVVWEEAGLENSRKASQTWIKVELCSGKFQMVYS